MKILYDNTLSNKQLPNNHKLLLNSHIPPSKLNIKLKTHSLTCLNIPLETFTNYNDISSFQNDYHQKTIAGSVDLISEMQQQQQQLNNENFLSSKPLINLISSNNQQEWQHKLKDRFRITNSFITPTSLNDSIVRLRRSGRIQNIHQTSLQTINNITERKCRPSFTYNRSIPKFTFRDLPSSSKIQMSQYISLPEIRSFSEQNFSKSQNNKLKLSSSSWKKSSSWSWKSNNDINFNRFETKQMINDNFHSNLPVIIESPLQNRHYLKPINQNCSRLYKKNIPFTHSISNYDVSSSSSNRFSSQVTSRYPSTPLLASSRQNNIDKFHILPLATFDDDDDTDSISSNSSFRSCLNSINEYSEDNFTEFSSSSSDDSFQDISSDYDLNTEIINKTTKSTRFFTRNFCSIQ